MKKTNKLLIASAMVAATQNLWCTEQSGTLQVAVVVNERGVGAGN